MNDEVTTIKIKKSTRARIMRYGAMGDSYDDALVKIMDKLDEYEKEM